MEKYYIWLLLALGEGEPVISELIARFGSAEKVYGAFQKNVALVGAELTAKAASVSIERAQKTYESILADGYSVITIDSPDYPEHLRTVKDPPCVLFAAGDTSLLRKKLITVVGARSITAETAAAIPKIISRLGYQYAVVSSLSEGCDQLTCLNAIHSGISFIEVLPCGLAHTYPTGSKTLRKFLLASGGLLLTEYLPKTRSSPGSFLRRSRIIGGISRVTLVLQAGETSGSLATAEYSAAPLFLPPSDCTAPEYAGAINAMRGGAKPYLGQYSIEKAFLRVEETERQISASAPAPAEDLQEPPKAPAAAPAKQKFRKKPEKTVPAKNSKKSTPPPKKDDGIHRNKPLIPLESLEGDRLLIYKTVAASETPISVEEMIAVTGISPADMSALLLDLEIDGVITRTGSRYVASE